MNSRFPALPQSAVTASDVVALYLHRGAEDQCVGGSATRNTTPTAGSAIRHWARSAGKSSPNRVPLGMGPRTSVSNSGISFILIRCAPPSLLQHSPLHTRSPPRRLLFRGTDQQKSLCPGKQAASRGKILPSSRMGRCVVQQANHWWHTSGEGRADGSLRVVYAGSHRSCRPCPLRKPRQWNGSATAKPEPA